MRLQWAALLGTLALAVSIGVPASAVDAQPRSQHRTHGHAKATPKPAPADTGVPNAMQGFSKNRNEPIHIEANSLEVRDKENVATFRGKVHVVQGDTDMHCDVLTVYYEPPEAQQQADNKADNKTAKPGQPAPAGLEPQRIRRLEARGNVIVKQKEQTATGDVGEFDMRKNLITLRGNVAVSQGDNVLRGDRLLVDMKTGISHMESNSGRVQGLFQPSKRGNSGQPGSTSIMPNMH